MPSGRFQLTGSTQDPGADAALTPAESAATDTATTPEPAPTTNREMSVGAEEVISPIGEPVASLRGDEVTSIDDDPVVAGRSYYRDSLQGRTVNRPQIGDVRFSSEG